MALEAALSKHGEPRGGYGGWGDADDFKTTTDAEEANPLLLDPTEYDYFPPEYEKRTPPVSPDADQLHQMMDQLAQEAAQSLRARREASPQRHRSSKIQLKAYHGVPDKALDELAGIQQLVRKESEEQIHSLQVLKSEIDATRRSAALEQIDHEARPNLKGTARLRKLMPPGMPEASPEDPRLLCPNPNALARRSGRWGKPRRRRRR